MKKTLLSFILLTITLVTFAQSQQERDKVERLRIAFLTEELDLSVKEGQQFWPIYNEYQTAKKQVESETKALTREMRKTEKPSNADVLQAINQMTDLKISGVKSEQDYLAQSLEVLGGVKTLKLIRSEKEFRRRILKNLKEKGGERGRQGGPGGRSGGGRPGN